MKTNEIMDEQDLLNFALDQAITFLKKDGFSIENASNMLGICPNIVAKKSNKKYCLFIEGNEVRKQPEISKDNLNKMLEYAEKYKCIPLYGSFGFGASNHERFEKKTLLKDDPEGYYVNFTGFENLSSDADNLEDEETKKVEILNKAFNKQMKKSNEENKLGLTEYECDCYSNCFYVIYELTSKQFTFDEILEIYDYFTDVKDCKKPNVDIFKEGEEFRGFYRLSKNFSLTKDLDEEKRIHMCFAIYLASCIMRYDEKTEDITWNMECFENGVQYVIDEYNHELEFKEELKIVQTSDDEADDYGFTIENPIEVTSVAIQYQYLNAICQENGDLIKYNRIGSFIGNDDIYIDGYTIFDKKTGKEITTLYLTGDASKNTEKVPKGFKFIDEKEIKKESNKKTENKKYKQISEEEKIYEINITDKEKSISILKSFFNRYEFKRQTTLSDIKINASDDDGQLFSRKVDVFNNCSIFYKFDGYKLMIKVYKSCGSFNAAPDDIYIKLVDNVVYDLKKANGYSDKDLLQKHDVSSFEERERKRKFIRKYDEIMYYPFIITFIGTPILFFVMLLTKFENMIINILFMVFLVIFTGNMLFSNIYKTKNKL